MCDLKIFKYGGFSTSILGANRMFGEWVLTKHTSHGPIEDSTSRCPVLDSNNPIAPENRPTSQKETSRLPTPVIQVRAVSFKEETLKIG